MKSSLTQRLGPLTINLDRQRFAAESLGELLNDPQKRRMQAMVSGQFTGKTVNPSEGRTANHWALRAAAAPAAYSLFAHACQIDIDEATSVKSRLEAFADEVRNGQYRTPQGETYTHIVHIGIGGSDLGPQLLDDVFTHLKLEGQHPHLDIAFLSNVDYHEVQERLACLDPTRTLVTIVSKSFTTRETLLNAGHVRRWLREAGTEFEEAALVGITCKPDKAIEFGIDRQRVFEFSEKVGGRFSLWGPVSASIRMKFGNAVFNQFLEGAALVDEHVALSPVADSLPAWLAICDYYNLQQGIESLMLSPYDSRLGLLVPYLQQLWMESLGKGVTNEGKLLGTPGCPALWGDVGTNGQHAFFQMLHQSALECAVELLAVVCPAHDDQPSHQILLSHFLAQAEAFYNGRLNTDEQRNNPEINYRTCPGKRPVHVLMLDRLSPYSLGCLLATWEHRTTLLAAIQDINPFDQWGVELGKTIAEQIEPCWTQLSAVPKDPVTRHLLALMKHQQCDE